MKPMDNARDYPIICSHLMFFHRLGCPRCERYEFGSSQGLLNHMRIAHKQVFKNTEEGVRFCGVVVVRRIVIDWKYDVPWGGFFLAMLTLVINYRSLRVRCLQITHAEHG